MIAFGTRLSGVVMDVTDSLITVTDETGVGHLLFNGGHEITPKVAQRVTLEYRRASLGGRWVIVGVEL